MEKYAFDRCCAEADFGIRSEAIDITSPPCFFAYNIAQDTSSVKVSQKINMCTDILTDKMGIWYNKGTASNPSTIVRWSPSPCTGEA